METLLHERLARGQREREGAYSWISEDKQLAVTSGNHKVGVITI